MGCVNSVEDKGAAGTVSRVGTGQQFATEAAAAVAQLLGAGTSALVEVSVKCQGLPDKDILSKSDAMAVLRAGEGHRNPTWSEVGRTDTVANSLNPTFRVPIRTTYHFERLQPMQVAVYDVDVSVQDNMKLRLEEQDFLGYADFLLSDLLTAHGSTLSLQLNDKHGRPLPGCSATLIAEQLPHTNDVVEVALSASNLDNKDSFGKSDPFLLISKGREVGHVADRWSPVLKTEVISNNLNPTWRPFKVSLTQLCNCDYDRPLKIEVYDADDTGDHDLIGECETSLSALQAAVAGLQGMSLIHPQKRAKLANYVNSGMLLPRSIKVSPRPSFLDYINGGMELSFIVAVDYTASNGDPRNPQSLHYASQQSTVYEDAIRAVGRVLEGYDTDKQFPAYGFGAALPPNGATSHCFALNGDPANPEVAGVDGILKAYRKALSVVRLYGPTLFAPIINAACQIASQPSRHLKYYVLLILTDGCIMDMGNTLKAVVEASHLPLSLLIVGVGNEDFSAMEALDCDKGKLRAPGGKTAARDCVQFCELRTHQRDTVEGLAAKLLAELPGQVVQYFHEMRQIPPPARPSASPSVSPPAAPPASGGAGPPFGVPPPCTPASPGHHPPPAVQGDTGAYLQV